jgi:hypothetical protein
MAVMNDRNFDEVLQRIVNPAWEALKLVVDNFLGRREPPRARQLIEEMPEAYQMIGFSMLLRIHFLPFHLSFLSINFGNASNEPNFSTTFLS